VALFAAAGIHVGATHLRLVLPFGISFFTFETMSYTIDVYRRDLSPADRYLDYLLFVCFFPHLVAGPIVRPHQMLPQLAARPVADADVQARGLWLIVTGLGKKIAIGDFLAVSLVGRAFGNPERYSSVELVVAAYAYAIQIYCDFSGYTDVALGSALLFGYRLPENFDAPYTARNLQEFWRRWHISLSTWLRDYLYVPLGGSREGAYKTYRNLMITMVLGGLWHGASWNFVIWGGLHGAGLGLTRFWQRARRARSSVSSGSAWRVVATFHFVCFAWIFFRAPTLGHAWLMIERIARGTFGTANLGQKVEVVIVLGFGLHWLPKRWVEAVRELFVRTPAPVQGIVLAAAAYGLHLAVGAKAEPFVYGQF
jgi:D-alanyl-lipoteichoic acid acyltransferase DltB (MBOAT superfamily)